MRKKHKILIIVLVIIAILFIAGWIVYQNINNNLESLTNMSISDVDLSNVKDGAYFGSYDAFPISVEVEVAVNNHQISKIDLIKHDNGQGGPAEVLTEQVVESQSVEIDAISGATYSSKVILKAIENALLNAVN